MFSTPVSPYDIFLVAAVFVAALIIKVAYTRQPPSPPGPKGLPLLGNALEFPPHNLYRACASWASRYGSYDQLSDVA